MARNIKYDSLIEKYLALYPHMNNSALAAVICEEEEIEAKPDWLRQVIGDYLRDLLPENVRLAKSRQKQMDRNRIERKGFREYARIENAVEEYAIEIKKLLKEQGEFLSNVSFPTIETTDDQVVGIYQVSDWHGNEMIDLPHNKFDFNVLAKRAKKQVKVAKRYFKAAGIKKVLFAATGDMLNSDRRLDELLSMSTNRAKASLLTFHILKHVILDLRKDFTLDIVSVMGNESRIHKDMSFYNDVISDNYDFTIFAHLKEMFKYANIEGINFISIDQMEEVVNVLGQNWLLTHDYMKSSTKQDKAQSTVGRYSLTGTKIDYIITGHIHATRNTDIISRSSSMAGSNEYNENALNLAGRAGQNIYIVTPTSRDIIAVDLQNIDGIEGYNIKEELEAYNAKSASKTKPGVKIFEIVI